MKQYIFTQTHNSSRGGLMVSFPLWDKEMFLEHIKKLDKKEYSSMYRFGAIGGYMNNLKDMSLTTFEKIFTENPFSKEQITAFFRKEISLKYGEHKEKALIKPLSKKDLKTGCHYKDFSGFVWVYLGYGVQEIDKTAYRSHYEKKPIEIKEGYMFVSDWYVKRYVDELPKSVEVLKGIKKLVEIVEENNIFIIPESKELWYKSGHKNYREYEMDIKITFK